MTENQKKIYGNPINFVQYINLIKKIIYKWNSQLAKES